MRVFTETASDFIGTMTNLTAACFLVNSVTTNLTAACLLTQVSNATAASLLSQVSQATAASLLSQVSQATAASLLSQVSQATAASLLSQVSQATAASLLSQVSQATAASLLSQVSQATAASLLSQVSQATAASLLAQVSNPTAACLVTLLGDLGIIDTTISNTTAATALTNSSTRNILTLNQSGFNISVSNSCPTGLVIQLQLSPDNVNWTNDSGTRLIAASSTGLFAPSRFSKYARIQYASQTAGCTVTFNELFQGHVS